MKVIYRYTKKYRHCMYNNSVVSLHNYCFNVNTTMHLGEVLSYKSLSKI